MPTTKPRQAPRAQPARDTAADEATQQPQNEPDAPVLHTPRLTVPNPPSPDSWTGLGDAHAVEAIRGFLQAAVYQRHTEAPAAALADVKAVSPLRLPPAVAQYRAEAIDYLGGRLPQ